MLHVLVAIATSRQQLQNTRRAFLKSNCSERSDKCHSRESIDFVLSSFCLRKCQNIRCFMLRLVAPLLKKKKNKISIIIGGEIKSFILDLWHRIVQLLNWSAAADDPPVVGGHRQPQTVEKAGKRCTSKLGY